MALRTALNLCDGYGGFSRALVPFGVRTVCRVERDSYAAAILMERMGEARLDQAPIWDDLETFDGVPWRGRVDWITAGFPCPDFSSAGSRAGVDGEHWLWPRGLPDRPRRGTVRRCPGERPRTCGARWTYQSPQ